MQLAFAREEHRQQKAEAHALGKSRGQRRAGNAHAEDKDEQRVQQDVQNAAGGQADHGKGGLALIAQHVVHGEAGTHQRRGRQDVAPVVAGVGQDGVGGAQQLHQRLQKEKAAHAQQRAAAQRGEKAHGGDVAGPGRFLLAQQAADDAARAHAHHEAERLQDGHQAEHHAHRAGGAVGVQLAHEKGVGQIVDGTHQHAGHRGDGQGDDELWDGRLGHLDELGAGRAGGLLHIQLPPLHKRAAGASCPARRPRRDPRGAFAARGPSLIFPYRSFLS